MGLFDMFKKKEGQPSQDATQMVISSYENFYEKNKNQKLSFYGFIAYDKTAINPIYRRPYSETIDSTFPFDAACIWEEMPEKQRDELQQQAQFGNIVIASEGCGIYWLLIVNGKYAGHVWLYTESGITPIEQNLTLAAWQSKYLESGDTFWREIVKQWGAEENAFFYGHVSAKMIAHEQFAFAVSAPLCRVCCNMMLNYAKNTGQEIVITDPTGTRAFMPDLTVQHI